MSEALDWATLDRFRFVMTESLKQNAFVAESFRTDYRIVDQFGRSIPMPDKHGFKIGDTITVKRPHRFYKQPE